MQVYGQAGQHTAALKQYQLLEQTLRKELGLDPQPETRALYKQIRKGDIKHFQKGTQSEKRTPRNNLPHRLTSFIGREQEQAEIIQLLAKNRLITLVGVGGVGKSRLALQVGERTLSNLPDGVWLVELAPISDPALVPQIMLNTLGLLEQAGHSPLDILADFLHTKKALLILDNCEHLIQACAQLSEALLHSCLHLQILATSREALSIEGETVYLVPTLSTPDPLEERLESLSDYDAVQLFIERAQTAFDGFRLTVGNAAAIAQVCHRLDGIPLALELAAARVQFLRVEEIAERLDDRFQLLTSGSRTALPRHQTLQAMIDWSHSLLSGPEQVLLRRLSVFAGGWALEAAESVCVDVGQDGILSHEVLNLLASLVNKSIILAKREQGKETRYLMLETIREYARDKLAAAGEGEKLRQRHLAYFVGLAERAEPNLRAFGMIEWLDRLEAEHDNIRTALAWAQESDVEAGLRLASALLWFWHIRGYLGEAADWLEHALIIEARERVERSLSNQRALARAKALHTVAWLRDQQGNYRQADELWAESLLLFRKLGSLGRQTRAYALLYSKDLAGAIHCLKWFQEVEDKFGIAECLHLLAAWAMSKDQEEKARALYEGHLALRKEVGDKDGLALAHQRLGLLAIYQGDYQLAKTLLEQSVAGFRDVGNRLGAASFGELDLGRIALMEGEHEQSAKQYNAILVLGREKHDKFLITDALYGLGQVARAQGYQNDAFILHAEALKVRQEMGNPWLISRSLRAIALLAIGGEQSNFSTLRQVAQILGRTEPAYERHKSACSPIERDENDQAIAIVRAALGEQAFAAAWEEGKKMTLDEAIRYALVENDV
jgi:non-specific serine/threonine protein kinase